MDTKEGHCWRCNKELERNHVNCESCHIAEYCSVECMERDMKRHKCVECPTWSPKTCANSRCSKVPTIECSDCYTVWYCSNRCRRQDRDVHDQKCKEWQQLALFCSMRIHDVHADYPYYFSNSFTKDLLNLKNNELAEEDGGASNSSRVHNEFRILLAACGDLCHVFQTIQSLPDTFQGKITFALNDIDPFVMARNVLLLYMVSCVPEEKTTSVATIWLSVLLPEGDYNLLQETLARLINMDHTELKENTGGLIDIHAHGYGTIREVWIKWESMVSSLTPQLLQRQRREFFGPNPCEHHDFVGHIEDAPKRHIPSIRKWFTDGVIVPEGQGSQNMTRSNPTLTGRGKPPDDVTDIAPPESTAFNYCVRTDCVPYQMWDYLEMVRFRSVDSITEMSHAFTTHCIDQARAMMNDKRLSFTIFLKDFQELETDEGCEFVFDRIFASNLTDYYSKTKVLSVLEPLLSKDNQHAVILTETVNWNFNVPEAVWPKNPFHQFSLVAVSVADGDPAELEGRRPCCYHEYYNNINYFIAFLRGELMFCTGVRDPLPSMEDIMNCQGLVMRDFRRGRNKVVPFAVRAHARTINMLSGDDRTLEWYRQQRED